MSAIFLIIFILFSSSVFADEPPLELEPIVITKSKTHLLRSYSVESPFGSPIEALSILPLDLQSRSPKSDIQTDFSLRGSTFQGVLILVDGQRVNDPQTGHHHSDIPLTSEDIQRIEVIPGASSSIFGPDAIGGAINIITKRPTKKKTLQLSLGEHKLKSASFSLSHKKNNLGIRYSLEREESGGFYYDTDFKKFTTSLNSSLDIPDGKFNLILGYQEKEFGAYDFYTPGSGYASFEWTKTYLLNTGLEIERDSFLIKPNFLWRRHYDKFLLDKTLKKSTYLNHHRTDMFTPNIYIQKKTKNLGRIGLGLEYGEERINSTRLGKRKRDHKSIFMNNSQNLTSQLALGLSFRLDDFDGFDEVYTGALNLSYSLCEQNSIHLGISRSVRIPSFTELYYIDPTTVGDSSLSTEKSWDCEMGYDYKRERLSVGISLFLREEKDFIDWVKRTASQARWQAENIIEAEVFGIENYLSFQINKDISLNSNYTYINKRINEEGFLYKYGPNYIKHLFNSVFSFNLPFGIQSVGFTYKKKPRRDGWLLLNTYLSYNLNKNLQAFLNITNSLNVEYQEIKGIPQPGRWMEAGVRLEW